MTDSIFEIIEKRSTANLYDPTKSISSCKVTLKSLGMYMRHLTADFAEENSLVYFLAVDDVAMRFELKHSSVPSKI